MPTKLIRTSDLKVYPMGRSYSFWIGCERLSYKITITKNDTSKFTGFNPTTLTLAGYSNEFICDRLKRALENVLMGYDSYPWSV